MGCRGLTSVPAFLTGCLVLLLSLCMPATSATPSSDPLPRRAFLGVNAEPSPNNHVRIGRIIATSSAARSELAVGDILLALNGTPVESVDAFLARVKSFKSGDHITWRVERAGKEMLIEVTLGEGPGSNRPTSRSSTMPSARPTPRCEAS